MGWLFKHGTPELCRLVLVTGTSTFYDCRPRTPANRPCVCMHTVYTLTTRASFLASMAFLARLMVPFSSTSSVLEACRACCFPDARTSDP